MYRAGVFESGCDIGVCIHEHETLEEAFECASSSGPAWYVSRIGEHGRLEKLNAREQQTLDELTKNKKLILK